MLSLLTAASYMAHGYCLLWQPWLVALNAIPDLLIFLSYSAIPIALWKLVRLRPELQQFRKLGGLFALFILLCGLSHLVSLITLWWPIYPVLGLVKMATAAVSVTTAIVLFPLVPRLAALPSPAAYEQANQDLTDEIRAHNETLIRLRASRDDLERQVAERTRDLAESNERLRILTRETVHRSRNLLTVVQSLARQTARGQDVPPQYLEDFTGRLLALGRATDVVVSDGGGAADLERIVESQLGTYRETYEDRVAIDLDPKMVRNEAAQQIALALHELATNAVKYGALREDGTGRVTLTGRAEADRYVIDWKESGATDAPAAESVPSSGFGRKLLERAVPMQLSAQATREMTEDGLNYRLSIPMDQLEVRDHTSALDLTREAYAGE